MSHECCSISSAVGRASGSTVRQVETKLRAVSDTLDQYSAARVSGDRSPRGVQRLTWLKAVVACHDGFHFLLLSITVEWRIT